MAQRLEKQAPVRPTLNDRNAERCNEHDERAHIGDEAQQSPDDADEKSKIQTNQAEANSAP